MAFLIYPDDFKVSSRDEVVKAIVRQDNAAIQMASNAAIEEMKGYLGTRYDVDNIFNKVATERNILIVLFAADIALYHLYSGLTNHKMPEEKQKRYDRAVQWLKDVARGDVQLNGLPLVTDPVTGEDSRNPMKWGSNEKYDSGW